MQVEQASQTSSAPAKPGVETRIAKAAAIIMMGSVLGRVLGMIREIVIAYLFGRGSAVDAFTVSSQLQTVVYDLLIGGMISAALVPVFSEYGANHTRHELGRLVGTILSFAILGLVVVVLLLEATAPWVISVMGSGFDPETHRLATDLLRVILPALLLLGISAVLMAALYALQRFTLPALISAALNIVVVLAALVFAHRLGVVGVAVGVVVGSLVAIAIQLPGLRDLKLSLSLDFSHPAVRKIWELYLPVLLGLVVTQAVLIIDRSLASQTGEGSISAMRYATALIQTSLGLVSMAISMAILPTLSRLSSDADLPEYRRTLTSGLKLILVLTIPVTLLLVALAGPVVTLVYQHGSFTATDRVLTVSALLLYLPGLPFAAIDQLLIMAFYAQEDTRTPVIVGIVAVGVYLVVALGLIGPLGMRGLVIANSAQWACHGIVMLVLVRRYLGKLRGHGLIVTTGKIALGSVLMSGLALLIFSAVGRVISTAHLTGQVVAMAAALIVAGAFYLAIVLFAGVQEVRMIWNAMKAKAGLG